MDALEQLRKRAADKRDLAIRSARETYRNDIRAIDALISNLPSHVATKPRKPDSPVITLILQVMPRDKPFTIPDLMSILRAGEPGRYFHESSVRTYVCRLAQRGSLRKLHKTYHNYTLWAATGAPASPFAEATLADMAQQLIEARGPMTTTEITIAAQAMGFRAEVSSRCLARSFRDGIRKSYQRFGKEAGGRWSVMIGDAQEGRGQSK